MPSYLVKFSQTPRLHKYMLVGVCVCVCVCVCRGTEGIVNPYLS